MEGSGSTTLFPLHRTKTLHLVRHAHGAHQLEVEDRDALKSEELFDAQLSLQGWQQVDNLNKHINECGLAKKVELVIVSPLLRTMQTAVGAFGGVGDYADGTDVTPLMVENAGNSNRSATSNINTPPFLAVELCRERLGVYYCNRRRATSEYRTIFPAIDFSLIENEEDVLWKADARESYESLAVRGMQFIDWLWTRKEKEIAVVTHSCFLFHTLGAHGKDYQPTVQQEMCTRFANCELRSVVIADRG
ncbi:phosphoglycerate mutase-like protein 1 [Papaver somniferum]|uniref:phosphoglycerate mutase-like protein 1 n=1 Tax=Papaver somniferum TaxID=3469 RepID=UPI000E6FCF9C|nr:phosphoglycerate mutase-like protein 1 [Papaver somniferum]XP_026435610.1 phosphoglycerate mutase-like protein 1 [Papaver somniferum]